MDSYDSEQRRIFLHFSRSTRFAFFCTAPNSMFADFSQFFSRKFPDFPGFFFAKFCEIRERYYQKTIPAIPASPRGAQLVSVLSGLQAQQTLYHVKPPNCQEAAPYRSCSLAHKEFSGNQRHVTYPEAGIQSSREERRARDVSASP